MKIIFICQKIFYNFFFIFLTILMQTEKKLVKEISTLEEGNIIIEIELRL